MAKYLALCLAVAGLCLAPDGSARSAASQSDDVYAAVRSNDLARVKTLVGSAAEANAKDEQGDSPLLYSAAVGSVDVMKYLLDKGADVNAQNPFGTTALMISATDIAKVRLLVERGADVNRASKQGRTALSIAAMSDQSSEIVRYLAAKGADLQAKDAFGNTILTAAAMGNDLNTLRIALDAGVDVNTAGVTGVTPLMLSAGYHANLPATKMLLAKGAKVNAVASSPTLFPLDDPKSGPIALHNFTPLLLAMPHASPEVVKTLLDAGADINAKDSRNMTPLMFAVATSHQNPAVIRMLIDRGADLTVQSNVAETAADWARKLGAPAGLELLKVARAADPAAAPPAAPSVDVKTATERGMALLETSSQKFFETSGCVSCHHQNVADFAAAEVRAKGLRIDPKAAIDRVKMLASGPPPGLLYERMDIGVPEIFASSLAALAAMGYPANRATDALVADIAASQLANGSWPLVGGIGSRPPAEEALVTRTALCVRSLKAYGPPGRATEMNARIAKASQWLRAATPATAEDRNMRLLGLHWAGADGSALKPLAATIAAAQRRDGGWAQIDSGASDAYATGQSLYALAKAGMAATDPVYVKGVNFLLARQAANGSWRVASRSPKFQAYFNSGFPYAGDQWISAWATGWATMALAHAAPATATRVSQ
jgi:ankyrin repeat protein